MRRKSKYVFLFFTGYCMYLAIEMTFRGFSYRLMGVAGGICLAGIGMLEDAGMRAFPMPVRMMIATVLITAVELYSGMFALRILHVRMWDYSGLPVSYCSGLISPFFSLLWYILSAAAVYTADYVTDRIYHENRFACAAGRSRKIRIGKNSRVDL